jgi:hypothetical protein
MQEKNKKEAPPPNEKQLGNCAFTLCKNYIYSKV